MTQFGRKPIPKKIRERVYAMYDGHCAYCGESITYKQLRVDHVNSVYRAEALGCSADNTISNLMPSCFACNYYKGAMTIEEFRHALDNMLMRNVRRPFDYRLALKYGMVKEDIKPTVFYFETHKRNESE